MSRTSASRCTSCPVRARSSQKMLTTPLQPSLFENTSIYEARPTLQIRRLHEAIAQYLCLDELRQLATRGEDIRSILRRGEPVPEEIQSLISLLSALLAPVTGEAIRSPSAVAALLITAMGCLDHEEFWVVCLDTGNHVQRVTPLYRGTLNSAPVRAAEVFRPAISLGSASIIVAHNHPGGTLQASPEDLDITRDLRQAGKLLQIDLLDHLIIAPGHWLSLREQHPLDW